MPVLDNSPLGGAVRGHADTTERMLLFKGGETKLEISGSSLDLNGELTIDFWISANTIPDPVEVAIITVESDSNGFSIIYKKDSSGSRGIRCKPCDSVSNTFFGNVNIEGSWQHIACSFNGASHQLYIDGKVTTTQVSQCTRITLLYNS